MGIVLGIDIGGTTTKIVGFSDGDLVGTLQVRAADQITSLYGALGNFLRKYAFSLDQILRISLTGVGASFITENIYDIPTTKTPEFRALGLGGTKLAGLTEALVVSMGTGSAFVRVSNSGITHIGGSGVGGGTLIGLSSIIMNENDIAAISMISDNGDLSNIDLTVQEITGETIPNLPPHTTAANFGKEKSMASHGDIGHGLINMILQTIGMLAVFACLDSPIKDVVLTGSLTTLPQIKKVFIELENLHGLRFIIPEQAIFAAAMGAAMSYEQ